MPTMESNPTEQVVESSRTEQTVEVQGGVADATSLQGNRLPSDSPSDGELLRYNGTEWEHVGPDITWSGLHTFQPQSDGSIVEWDPSQVDSDAGNFMGTVRAFNVSTTRDNVVYRWGYNVGSGGGTAGGDDAAMYISWETFWPGGSSDPDQAMFEFHQPEVNTEDGLTQIRPRSLQVRRDWTNATTSTLVNVTFTFNNMNFSHVARDGSRSQVAKWVESADNAPGGSIFLGMNGNPVKLVIEENNFAFLTQRGSDGGAKKLLYLDSNDRLRFQTNDFSTPQNDWTFTAEQPQLNIKGTDGGETWQFYVDANGHLRLQNGGNDPIHVRPGVPSRRIYIRDDDVHIGVGTDLPFDSVMLAGDLVFGLDENNDRVRFKAQESDDTTIIQGAIPHFTGSAYSSSNVTTDRSFDADNTTTAELADVLGTLISDLNLN